jgi:hypothetical protein
MLFNTSANIIQEILATKIPIPFTIDNPSHPDEKIIAYNLNQPDDFLGQIITVYGNELEKIPFSSEEDKAAYNKTFIVIRDIKEKGKELLDFAKEIRDVLCDPNATYSSIFSALGKSIYTVPKNNAIGKIFKSFRSEKGNNANILNALPEIKGSRSYLLAFLYSRYLEMSANTFVLNDSNDGLEQIPERLRNWKLVSADTKTSEQAGKNSFGIDCDERRRIVSCRSLALKQELVSNKCFILPQPVVEPTTPEKSISSPVNDADDVIEEKLKGLLVHIDSLLKKLNHQDAFMKDLFEKLQGKLKFYDFMEECLTNKSDDIFSSYTLTEWHDFFVYEINQSNYASQEVLDCFSQFWEESTKVFVQTPKQESKSIFSYFGFSDPLLIDVTEIRPKIKNEKTKIISDLSDLAKILQEQQLLIIKVTELRDKLKRSWSCYFKNHRNALFQLEKSITYISTDPAFFLGQQFTIDNIKNDLSKFKKHLNDFNQWENEIFKVPTSEKAKNWLEEKAKPQSRWPDFSSMFALGKVKQAFSFRQKEEIPERRFSQYLPKVI